MVKFVFFRINVVFVSEHGAERTAFPFEESAEEVKYGEVNLRLNVQSLYFKCFDIILQTPVSLKHVSFPSVKKNCHTVLQKKVQILGFVLIFLCLNSFVSFFFFKS